jgi:hypothetical protein
MKLYSYVVTHDTGFSPNPFWGCCTLADCKPAIRRTAKIGDWVVHKCGDNIYKPLHNGDFQQLHSMHSNGTNENPETKAHDLGGKYPPDRSHHCRGSSTIRPSTWATSLRKRLPNPCSRDSYHSTDSSSSYSASSRELTVMFVVYGRYR